MPPSYAESCKRKKRLADLDWLWQSKGQLKVISTPYHEGKHYATHPNQYLPIVDRLEELHNNGYVHGDIRAYNMVLNYEDANNPKGWLIDFDFGGRINERPKYPSGYVHSLDDGFRLGKPGKAIEDDHDWYALGQIIFSKCYTLTHPDIGRVTADVTNELLVNIPQKFFCLKGDYSNLQGGAVTFLRNYLRLAADNGFEFNLTDSFQKSLEDCNMLEDRKSRRTDSKGATGSPPKPKN